MSEHRFDIRRRSTGVALGDAVTAEQTAAVETYLRTYAGQRRFLVAMREWLADRGTLSRRQVAAVLQMMLQEGT